jgi:hypothetical protein
VTDDELPPGGEIVEDDPPWDAWRPEQIARLLAGVRVPWCVAAGWAIDLCRGAQTREHEDLEIAGPASPATVAPVRQALAGYDFEVVGTVPLLDPAARDWLGWALRRVHPRHRWIGMLEPA